MPLPDFDKLWDYQQPAETERAFRELLPEARESGDVDYLAQLLTQIARTFSIRREFDNAHAQLDEVEAMLSDGLVTARVRYLLERGRAFNSAGERDAARPLFTDAWDLAKEHRVDYHAVDAAHMLAIVESGDESLAWNERALEYAESAVEERARGWRGALYNNLGWTYHDRGDYERALAYFQKGLAHRRERGQDRGVRIARWTVARCLRSLGRVEEALAEQQALMEERDGNEDGYGSEEIAECLLALGRVEEARPSFARAYALLSEKQAWLLEQQPDRMARIRKLAEDA